MSIIAEHVCYQLAEGKYLISDINLELAFAGLHVILGPNGAGKSTLLNVLSGFVPASSGEVWLNQQSLSDCQALELSLLRAALPQADHIPLALTVYEIIALGRYPHQEAEKRGLSAKTAMAQHHKIIESAIAEMDIAHLLERPYASLSGGEKQRVQIARLLAQDTDVVLLDEPTSALDIAHQQQLLNILKAKAKEGKTVVLVLHDINMALRYADSIVLMHQGEIVAAGAPASVITAQSMLDVYGVDCIVEMNSTINALQMTIKS